MMEYKPFRCRCCGAHLALTNGSRLIFGVGAFTDEPIPIKCNQCGLRQVWKPVIDISQLAAYTEPKPA